MFIMIVATQIQALIIEIEVELETTTQTNIDNNNTRSSANTKIDTIVEVPLMLYEALIFSHWH